jgi:hypothetical protein
MKRDLGPRSRAEIVVCIICGICSTAVALFVAIMILAFFSSGIPADGASSRP